MPMLISIPEKRQDDLVAIALGENAQTFFGIQSSYIQLGHTALVLVIWAAFAVDPNFPLTNLPVEYRDFLKQGCSRVRDQHARGGAGFLARDRASPSLCGREVLVLGSRRLQPARDVDAEARGRKPRAEAAGAEARRRRGGEGVLHA